MMAPLSLPRSATGIAPLLTPGSNTGTTCFPVSEVLTLWMKNWLTKHNARGNCLNSMLLKLWLLLEQLGKCTNCRIVAQDKVTLGNKYWLWSLQKTGHKILVQTSSKVRRIFQELHLVYICMISTKHFPIPPSSSLAAPIQKSSLQWRTKSACISQSVITRALHFSVAYSMTRNPVWKFSIASIICTRHVGRK